MGDVFHTFPALSDALQAWPDLQVDWVVEEAFAEIPQWHPAVDQVFPIALRRWRKTFWQRSTRHEIRTFFQTINQTHYDLVLDAQGLLKSLWVLRKIRSGTRVGFDWQSAREPLASGGYQRKISVPKAQHAITRLRQLFSAALNYEDVSSSPVEYRLDTSSWQWPDSLPADFQ
ncbi:MAG: lipopolysaccharide heptosyltransferase I, partial [Hydrogenovibrio sp.]